MRRRQLSHIIDQAILHQDLVCGPVKIRFNASPMPRKPLIEKRMDSPVDHSDSPSTREALRRAYIEMRDLALYLSDECEMGHLPPMDSTRALRMFAGLLSLTAEIT